MANILGWIAFIFLLLGYFSFMVMADYLYRKKIIKHRLFGLRPDIVFVEYYRDTKREQNRVGSWFWLTIISFICMIVSGLAKGMITLFSR